MSTMLAVTDISKTYGFTTVLNRVSLSLTDGQRVGVVGANGVGKSTLFKIIIGEIAPDEGSVQIATGARVGYLAQVITGFEAKTIAELISESLAEITDLEARMRQLERLMSETTGAALDAVLAEYGEVSDQFDRRGGYDLEHRLDVILTGLQVGDLDRARPFATLSGGEKARVGLAILLLQGPDLLLLDEPTNHLDIVSLNWLEDYLAAYRGAMLIISHDRHFLNRIVTAIVEIDEHTRGARRYGGDYDAYHQAKQAERRKWEIDYARQQDEIKALRLEIKEGAHRNSNYRAHTDGDKFVINIKKATHDHTVSKRIRAAEEKLKRIEANPIPQPPRPLRFHAGFDPEALKGHNPVILSNISKCFGERLIFEDASLVLGPRARVALVGPNGAGKSTLLRILLGHEPADAGEVYIHPAARIGYLDQEQADLDPTQTVFEAYRAGLEGTDQQIKATLLQSGLFRYDELERLVGQLSSGQQRKLQIARLIALRANLLVLDEPTNYVSFDVLEEFEEALRGFPGPIIAASHDRRFLQQFEGDLWEVRDGALRLVLDAAPIYGS